MSQRLWEGQPYSYDIAEALLAKIRKQIHWEKFEEAAVLSEQLARNLRELKNG